jgi:hypothetical protein
MQSKYPNVRVALLGEDENAFAIVERVQPALREAGVPAHQSLHPGSLLERLLPLVGNRFADGRDDMSEAWRLRPVMAELADLSARKAAEELDRRKSVSATGGRWYAATVIKLRERIEGGK